MALLKVTEPFLDILIIHLVREKEVCREGSLKLEADDFTEPEEYTYEMVWAITKLYWCEHAELIPRKILEAEVDARTAGNPAYSKETLKHIGRLISLIYEYRENELNTEYGFQLLQAFVNHRQIRMPYSRRLAEGEDVDELVNKLTERFNSSRIKRPAIVKPMKPGADVINVRPPNPTGVTFFDKALGGGPRLTELIGILAPSGGGKTMLCVQVACEVAKRREHVIFLSYEQPVDGDLVYRVYSYMAGVPRTRVWDKTLAEWGDDDLEKLREQQEAAGDYLHMVDMNRPGMGSKGVEEIESIIHDISTEVDSSISMVVIDWFWPMVLRYVFLKDDLKIGDGRAVTTLMVDRLHSAAAKLDTRFLIAQQIKSDSAGRSPGSSFDWFDSAEAKNFAWLMEYCFAIGTAGDNGIRKFVLSKARSARTKDIYITMNAEYNRFEEEDGNIVYSQSHRKLVKSEDLHAVAGAKNQAMLQDGVKKDDKFDPTDVVE